MSIPKPGQTAHLMTRFDVLRVLRGMHRNELRNRRELDLYTLDDLRRLYGASSEDPIYLSDGIVSRVQLVAVIRWRVWCSRVGNSLLALVAVIGAVAAVIAAIEGWK